MKSFLKIFFASLLAIIVSTTLLFILLIGLTSAASKLLISNEELSGGNIVTITLNEQITDSPVSNPFALFNPSTFEVKRSISISSLLEGLEKASIDPNISAIFLDLSSMQPIELATVTEIRNALQRFKLCGKPIYCYSDYYSQTAYFLATVADKIYTPELGVVELKGLASQTLFFKGTLDKLGVEPEIIRHGEFKSAIEPFTQESMSSANRKQTSELLSSVWDYMLSEISKARSIEVNALQKAANSLLIKNSNNALEFNLIDKIEYKHAAQKEIAEAIGDTKFQSISLFNYINSPTAIESKYSKNKIAIIYADGEIVSTTSGANVEIVSDEINKKLIKAAADSTIKSVVLRINSPGGSALAADNIWKEVKNLRNKKPVIVSMSNSAASGGYYIAAPADVIIAEPTTITGSIGVFGLLFNAKRGLKDKLGITVDGVNTNPSADIGSITRPLTSSERKFIQNSVDDTYNTFIKKVAEGRNLSVEKVNKIAQGRVWSGIDAVKIGLVDGLGGLSDAIGIAADRAGIIDSFRIYTFSDNTTPLDDILNSLLFTEVKAMVYSLSKSSKVENSIALEYEKLRRYMNRDKIQSIMPYTIKFY